MNDILLTPEEMAEAKSAARQKSTTTTHAALASVIDDALCRAQVGKVWKEIETWAYLSMPVELIRALKATGEVQHD